MRREATRWSYLSLSSILMVDCVCARIVVRLSPTHRQRGGWMWPGITVSLKGDPLTISNPFLLLTSASKPFTCNNTPKRLTTTM